MANRSPGQDEWAAHAAMRRGCAALAAGDHAEATQWFARARRLAPQDAAALYLLATSLVERAPERALGLLDDLLARAPKYREARISRLALLHRLGNASAAACELDAVLCHFAVPVAPWFSALADAVCAAAGIGTPGCAGWVGVAGDGRVLGRGAPALRLGRRRLLPSRDDGTCRLPAGWRRTGGPLVSARGVLGARIDLTGIARVDGAVAWAPDEAALSGWAAAAADPDTSPLIEVFTGMNDTSLAGAIADDADVAMAGDGVVAARGFRIALADLPPGTTLHVRTEDGRHLAGSPLRVPTPRRHVPAASPDSSWRDRRRRRAVVLVTHASGGGVERQVAARAAELQAEGARAIVVRPGRADSRPRTAADVDRLLAPSGFAVADGVAARTLHVPTVEALADLLRDDRPVSVELHHVAAHDPAVLRLAGLLRVPFDVVLHDFAAICPRVTLCGGADRYCGEPADRHACEDCIADHGARIPLAGSVAAHRARQAMLLCAARFVVAPSRDTADRLRRFVPRIAPTVTPWEDDAALTRAVQLPPSPPDAPMTVAVVGAIGVDKGFAVLLACARDAARRRLPLRFVVVGHTIDDDRLLATGCAFVTGRFAEGEAPALLAEFAPSLGLLPSVWPETWCFALSALWQAGLHVLAFDLGAQAERIAATGAGTLLPLGTAAPAINDHCLALVRGFVRPARPRLLMGGRPLHG